MTRTSYVRVTMEKTTNNGIEEPGSPVPNQEFIKKAFLDDLQKLAVLIQEIRSDEYMVDRICEIFHGRIVNYHNKKAQGTFQESFKK